MLEQVFQGGGRCPIPGDFQGHVGWGSEQPGRVDAHTLCKGFGLYDL